MDKTNFKSETTQNLGTVDRVIRCVLAVALFGASIAHMLLFGTYLTPVHGLIALLSVYPALTGILGWDPFYQMAHVKSCRNKGRDQSGTLPFESDAVQGHHPIPNEDAGQSITRSHHLSQHNEEDH
jgi:Inner membrane protein YgaP-like, transmembrane domain